MIKLFRYVICTFIIAILATSFTRSVATPLRYQYAFLSVDDLKNAHLGIVDPQNPQAPAQWNALVTPLGSVISYATASPDGQWIAFFIYAFSSNRLITVRLLNVASGSTQDIAQGDFPDSWELLGYSGPFQDIAWSPDSRYLALNMVQSGKLDAFAYSLDSNTLINLTKTEESTHFQVAWSKDSRHLVTISESCPASPNCSIQLEAFDVQSKTLVYSIDVSQMSVGAAPGTSVCQLDWSPDGHYVSFVATCNGTTGRPEELYLWDIPGKSVMRVTNFTVGYKQPTQGTLFGGQYATYWSDAETLLVGAQYGAELPHTETVSYQTSTKTLQVLSSALTDGWTVNPTTGELAFRTIPTLSDWNTASSSSLQIGTLHGQTFTAKTTTPPLNSTTGCNPSWSPDGAFLVYSIGNCQTASPERFVFIDNSTGKAAEHVLSANEQPGVDGDMTIGWIVG